MKEIEDENEGETDNLRFVRVKWKHESNATSFYVYNVLLLHKYACYFVYEAHIVEQL